MSEQELKLGANNDVPLQSLFTVNEHGHTVLKVTSRSLSGEEEIAHLENLGFRIGKSAKPILKSEALDGYDSKHLLGEGDEYNIVLIFGRRVLPKDCTTKYLQEHAAKYGYEIPKAAIMPRLREVISDEHLKHLGISYIAGLHEDCGDSSDVLCISRDGSGQWLGGNWSAPGREWDEVGAFAFVVPTP